MESLLTLSIGDYRAVELSLRLTMSLIVMTALLQVLCLSVVARNLRLPLIFSSVALLEAAWFASSVCFAWKGAFELAGTSYCVTGHPLAGEGRIIAWSLGGPAILICFGLLQLNPREKFFRNLCGMALGWAILGPFYQAVALIGFILCVLQFREILPGSSKKQRVLRAEAFVAIVSMALGFLIAELGCLHLLPLGKSATEILIRGEVIHSFCNLFTLVVPGLALLIGILRISPKNPQLA